MKTIIDRAVDKRTAVVLVHGAWLDGSSWGDVISALQSEGLTVVSAQIPLTSLADDVAATRRAIARTPGPVVLAGHCYGGTVITEAGSDPKVVALVYVAAFAPGPGRRRTMRKKASLRHDTWRCFKPTPPAFCGCRRKRW